ncbi:MAG: YggS family pyridoxal phosphate enzyme [Candidatus Reconcilbacillus cellulovorans]|uniref:Pyridoxal phosphate homeostasis protein n=1 Tax=Candidatus Reconcilbacillus cellulovorans TaxID=1906605 RepID=A0A2A6E4G4_9BACL|nr:MAG: YggS family pyridoxal phosphate enzyme [Candidatus Reconcilbacillus cellulovorans]
MNAHVEIAELQTRLEGVEERIASACRRAGRDRSEVSIVAVTKNVSAETVRALLELGVRHIGENRWQQARPKWEAIGREAVWHFIGHLQTNKVKDVVGRFAYVHSLDRLSLAEELERRARAAGTEVFCFIQVNVSGEPTKHGLAPAEVEPFCRRIAAFPHLKPIGLMTMAPAVADAEEARPVFRRLRELRDELNACGVLPQPLRELSMGMSNDFEVAVEEGATWVRLGTVLVGRSSTLEPVSSESGRE